MDGEFQVYLAENGIISQTTYIDTSAQKGVAKRKSFHLLEAARALMFPMGLSKPY